MLSSLFHSHNLYFLSRSLPSFYATFITVQNANISHSRSPGGYGDILPFIRFRTIRNPYTPRIKRIRHPTQLEKAFLSPPQHHPPRPNRLNATKPPSRRRIPKPSLSPPLARIRKTLDSKASSRNLCSESRLGRYSEIVALFCWHFTGRD